MGAAALEMAAAAGRSAQTQWRATVAARLHSQLWPHRRMLITAVDAHTGEPMVFDRDSGVYIPMEDLKREDYQRWKAMVDGGFETDIVGFQAMVVAALEEIIEAHPGQRVAVFCHGGVINVWTAHVLGMEPRLFFEPGYTSVHRYLCARSGQRNVVALNERFHLTPHWPAVA